MEDGWMDVIWVNSCVLSPMLELNFYVSRALLMVCFAIQINTTSETACTKWVWKMCWKKDGL